MLTKKDLDQIDEVLKKRIGEQIKENVPEIIRSQIRQDVPEIVRSQIKQDVPEIIKAAFQDFYDNIFEPHANKSEREHQEIISEMKSMKKEIGGLKDETSEIKEFIKDHEKRITALESISSVKN